MRVLFAVLFWTCSTSVSFAQYKIRFIVTETTTLQHDSIYITGSFNNWDSTANARYRLQPYKGTAKSIVLNLSGGKIEYKFTRGNWFTVEKQYRGFEVPNRVVILNKDTTLRATIESYRDELLIDKWPALAIDQPDSNRIALLTSIASIYALLPEYHKPDSAFYYTQQALLLLQKYKLSRNDNTLTQADYATFDLQEISATLLHSLGNYTKALELRLDNLKLAEQDEKDQDLMLSGIGNIISEYTAMKDYQNALRYSKLLQHYITVLNAKDSSNPYLKVASNRELAAAYYNVHLLDSSLYYAKRVYALSNEIAIREGNMYSKVGLAEASLLLGNIYSKKEDAATAMSYYRAAIHNGYSSYQFLVIARTQEGIARLYQKAGRLDSALYYSRASLATLKAQTITVQAWGENTNSYIAEISPLIASLYKATNQPDSAYKYLKLSVDLKDSLYDVDKIRQFQNVTFNEGVRVQQQEQEARAIKQRYENRIKIYLLVAGMALAFFIAFILYRNNQQKQKTNAQLHKKNSEIESTLHELKATQAQLVQSEKMASLGELTAGIAHEIQNPLNFVNNFSETNVELLTELKNEIAVDNKEEALTLTNDLIANEEKINQHGKRAEAIVKNMLQHSRTSKGERQPNDINALVDEYLRLAFHGFRAKDKGFNAMINTDFDGSIGKVNIVPQEIGRVLLNLFNNAFYAVHEQLKKLEAGYEPKVWVSTKKINDSIEIQVQDNGMGISKSMMDKIFQPFFTTKPTGEGTGLGLSLSYDIVKAHGGELKVTSQKGEGAIFTVILPAV